jgi:hypothetical protein
MDAFAIVHGVWQRFATKWAIVFTMPCDGTVARVGFWTDCSLSAKSGAGLSQSDFDSQSVGDRELSSRCPKFAIGLSIAITAFPARVLGWHGQRGVGGGNQAEFALLHRRRTQRLGAEGKARTSRMGTVARQVVLFSMGTRWIWRIETGASGAG